MRGFRAGFVVGPLVALLVVLVVLVLGGCSGEDPEVRIAPAPAATGSSPTVEPSPTPSQAALTATETVTAWLDARNAALRDGDTTAVEALGAGNCTTCQNLIDPIREVYSHGGHFETDGWRLVSSRLKPGAGRLASVDTAIEYAAGQTVPEAGAEPVVYTAEKHIVVFKLIVIDNAWRIRFVGFLS